LKSANCKEEQRLKMCSSNSQKICFEKLFSFFNLHQAATILTGVTLLLEVEVSTDRGVL